jgi:hypothetical protein
MEQIVNAILPVFLVIAVGAILTWRGFLNETLLQGMTRLSYYVGLPSLLFVKIATAPQIDRQAGMAFLILILGTVTIMLLSAGVALLMRLRGANIGTFVQGAFRGNTVFVGLPVIFYAFAGPVQHAGADRAQTVAALAIGPLVVFYNAASILVLLLSKHRLQWSMLKAVVLQILTNPLVIACAAGGAWQLAGLTLPVVGERTLSVLGQFALPVALLAVGGSLVATGIRGHFGSALLASLTKTLVSPAVGLGLGWLLGVDPMVAAITAILLGCPTAVASYILVDQLGGDRQLAASTIVLSTLMSAVTLAVIIALV